MAALKVISSAVTFRAGDNAVTMLLLINIIHINIGTLIISTGFWGPLYYKYN